MAKEDPLAEALDRIANRLQSIETLHGKELPMIRGLVAETYDELQELRRHVMDNLNRVGGQVRLHESQLGEALGRIAKLELGHASR